jgi:hypothetical protein
VARFTGEVRWSSAAAIVYLIVIGSVLITGSAGWLMVAGPARKMPAGANHG